MAAEQARAEQAKRKHTNLTAQLTVLKSIRKHGVYWPGDN